MDCIEIFAKVYNQNVCVHNYYVNTRTNIEERQFLHFRVNDLQNFIHLHLRDVHFTPLIQVEEMNINNIAENQRTEKISSLTSSDDELSGDDNDEHDADIATFNGGMNDINDTVPKYTKYYEEIHGHLQFYNIFKKKTFGHSCAVCDRLWWKNDLKSTTGVHDDILQLILLNYVRGTTVQVCSTCKKAMDKGKIPLLSTYNDFSFPIIPPHLPKLNLIEQRLVSPRIPFMQIRRLRHVNGQYGIYGQIINVPVEVNTMVNQLPRHIEDDHCFYVHIKKKLIHKTSYVHGLINKGHIKQWLDYLVTTLYS
ncbi:unnamed protein product [Euphydryas editha]|uniref:DUF6570 domain-containing protein n=1 Tax=Euphydryas editha TaxID=104508 RepID=A0AAU9TB63_EUPED|nr:unnamed protein product [Euphydryas editha]